MIKPSQHEKVKKDFIEFSGGYTPDWAAPEMELFIKHHEVHVPGSSSEEFETFFEQWLMDLEDGIEASVCLP